jgi:O-antigen ligase
VKKKAPLRDFLGGLLSNKPALALLILFFIHLFWLPGSENIDYGIRDIRIKLPLLLLPVAVGVLPSLDRKEVNLLSLFFIASVIAALLWCYPLSGYFGILSEDSREAAGLFISHIRFGLMAGMAVVLLIHLSSQDSRFVSLNGVLIALILALQWKLAMMTGLVVSAVALMLFVWHLPKSRLIVRSSMATLLLVIGVSVYFDAKSLLTPIEDFNDRATVSDFGTPYLENINNRQLENGRYVWNHIAPGELDSAWAEVSRVPLTQNDARGNLLWGTAIRHMTALGLTKDAAGVKALTPEQIKSIESGVASPYMETLTGFKRRWHETVFEWHAWRNGNDPSGNSLTQRLEYQKAAWCIISQNWLWGVGTGDVGAAFSEHYEQTDSRLQNRWRLRAHQQFLTLWVSFGLAGFIVVFWLIFGAPMISGAWRWYPSAAFLLIASLSFLTEDTLETQAGATYFAYFYCILVAGGKVNNQ